MIQANELRIGNFVNVHSIYSKISYLMGSEIGLLDDSQYRTPEDIEPIHLTPEILAKCVFTNSYKFGMVWHNFIKRYAVVVNGASIDNVPQYLHQLQNLYFALTGTELNVQL